MTDEDCSGSRVGCFTFVLTTYPFGYCQSRLCRYTGSFSATGAGGSVLTKPVLGGGRRHAPT